MTLRRGAGARLTVFALLLLAFSPLTAPFSTCDVADLLGGMPADSAAVVTHAKSSVEPTDTARPLPAFEGPLALCFVPSVRADGAAARLPETQPIPLRI